MEENIGWDWAPFVQAFGLGLFPWISQFKLLDIHFTVGNFNIKAISNFFAHLFSASIFFYISQSLPYEIIKLPSWWIFILISFVFCVIYFMVYFLFNERVSGSQVRWPVVINFISYVLIFCLLTAGFGLLKVYQGYYVLQGSVKYNNGFIPEALVVFKAKNGSLISEARTDSNGEFVSLLEKETFDKCSEFEVSAMGFESYTMLLSPSTIIESLENIQLTKQKQ